MHDLSEKHEPRHSKTNLNNTSEWNQCTRSSLPTDSTKHFIAISTHLPPPVINKHSLNVGFRMTWLQYTWKYRET